MGVDSVAHVENSEQKKKNSIQRVGSGIDKKDVL